MTTIQIDAGLMARLHELSEAMEFRDEQGRKLGYFIPVEEVDAETWEWARNAFTDEEIEEARQEPGGYTLQEVLNELGAE